METQAKGDACNVRASAECELETRAPAALALLLTLTHSVTHCIMDDAVELKTSRIVPRVLVLPVSDSAMLSPLQPSPDR